jgi:hypothetical protein
VIWKTSLLDFLWGLFRLAYTTYTIYILSSFYEEEVINISINPLVDTQRAASLQETETVKLTVLTFKSRVSVVYDNPRGGYGTRARRP